MPDLIPISERCTLAAVALLERIKLENGFANDAIVERLDPSGNPSGAENVGLHVIVWEASVEDASEVTPICLDGYRLKLGIAYTLLGGVAADGTPAGFTMAQAHADVRKALDVDRQLGGLAVNTEIGPPDPNWTFGGLPASQMQLTIFFWTKQRDPYSLPGA